MSEITTVATFTDANEAMLAQIHLSDLGIKAFVVDAELANMDWFYRNAIGYIKIQTPNDQAEAARALLETWRARRVGDEVIEENDDENLDQTVACLACGAVLPDDDSRCPACGWSYASAKKKSARVAPGGNLAASLASESGPDEIAAADAIEQAETNGSSLGLMIGLIIVGLFALGLLPRLREFVQTRF